MKKRAGSLRRMCVNAFYNPASPTFLIANDFFSFLTLLSIGLIIAESVHSLAPLLPALHGVEIFIATLFAIEYIGRVIGSSHKGRYIFSFFGLVDLLAIIPTFFALANLTALKSARILRILRFLRIIRLAKIARMSLTHRDVEEDGQLYGINAKIYFFAAISSVVILGCLIYSVEHVHPEFANIPLSMLWVLRVLLDVDVAFPYSALGMGIFYFVRFVSFVLLGLLIHVIGTSLNSFLLGERQQGKMDI